MERQAREFASSLQRVLNATVCRTARVGTALSNAPAGHVTIGTGVTARSAKPIPVGLTIDGTQPRCWLRVEYIAWLKEGYLTVRESVFTLSADPYGREEVFHYDYERDKHERDGYTEAHLQIVGESPPMKTLLTTAGRSKDPMAKLHFPVGGRRYRPSLEDVIEFLVNERLVRARDGWQKVLDASREEFRDRQLCAAIGFRPDVAIGELQRLGHLATR
ncbi:hypothetical protein [Phytohabitans rumicis]|uniref:hypothetical protein n=1 Tax=Phytohabitans rumicis TaxID=1076125 RepID=UPI001565FF1E|nr:hypothetical protein [Phytohabitans rumicis]